MATAVASANGHLNGYTNGHTNGYTNGHVNGASQKIHEIDTSHKSLPPFPSDVPTAPIATLSLKKIIENDSEEGDRVLEACRTHGFFYLDLTDDPSGQPLLEGSEEAVAMAKSVFDLPLEEKKSYALDPSVSLMGYKHAGTVKQTDKAQRPDTTEFMSVSKDHLHGFAESRTYPSQILASKDMLRQFTKSAHETGMIILRVLARKLGVEEDAFTKKNIFEQCSEDNMRMTKKTPHDENSNKIGLVSHTDFGSITLLWNWLGGLQIQSRDPAKTGEWEYVRPVPGACIVNLGDATVKFTDGMLKSAKHRVVNAPGEQNKVDRYSVVYFVRPNNDTLMQKVEGIDQIGLEKIDVNHLFDEEQEGKVYTALEWQQRRTENLQNGNKPTGD